MPLLCRFRRHRRSASLAWVDGQHVRSACKRCGTPLIRTAPRTWLALTGRLAGQFDTGRLPA